MKIRETQINVHENAVQKGFWAVTTKELQPLQWAMAAIIEICTAVECWRKTGDQKWHDELKSIADGLDVAISTDSNSILLMARLCLVVTEAAEAANAEDKEHLGEELADIVIRVLDMAGGYDIDLQSAIEIKMAKNARRPYLHGKKC